MSRNFVGQGSGYLHGDISKKMQRQEQASRLTGWGTVWAQILRFLAEPEQADISKSICQSCGTARLFDKNKKSYFINARVMDLESVKNIVAEIKKVNNG